MINLGNVPLEQQTTMGFGWIEKIKQGQLWACWCGCLLVSWWILSFCWTIVEAHSVYIYILVTDSVVHVLVFGNIYILHTQVYSGITVTLLAQHNRLPRFVAMLYCTIGALALASHAKTMFTDPGTVPPSAVPVQTMESHITTTHAMCSHCQSFKPPVSHHCRICNRCISRMDHHCPWMNNCVGVGNMSKSILFSSISVNVIVIEQLRSWKFSFLFFPSI